MFTAVVVDRLRHAHHVDAVVPQPVRGREGAFAADRDDAVDVVAVEGLRDVLRAAPGPLVGVGATRAEDGAADLGQSLHLVPCEREEVAVDDATPAVADADELDVVVRGALEDDAADDRIESGAVSAAGEDTDLHVEILW